MVYETILWMGWWRRTESKGTFPYVVAWLEDANAVAENYSIPSKKLSAIFQFAVAMPLFFYGIVLAGERSVVNSHADSVYSVLAVEGNDEQNQDRIKVANFIF